MTDIDLKNPEHLAAVVERQKRAFNKPCYRLVAIDKNGVLVRRDYESVSAAISEAKDFWVNKGFLAVRIHTFFYFPNSGFYFYRAKMNYERDFNHFSVCLLFELLGGRRCRLEVDRHRAAERKDGAARGYA